MNFNGSYLRIHTKLKELNKMKKAFIGLLSLVVALFIVSVSSEQAQAATFKDVPSSHWASTFINQASEKGLVAGYPDGTFKPSNQVTRAEFVAFLARAIEDNSTTTHAFTDVSSNFWAKEDIEKGIALGFVIPTEYANKKFEPNKAITRLEMTKMVARALAVNEDYSKVLDAYKGLYNGDMPFTDWKSMKHTDVPFIGLTVGTTIVSGYPDGSYGMNKLTNRAEATTMLLKFVESQEQSPFNYQYVNELYEVALTGTNALSVSTLEPRQESMKGLKVGNSRFDYTTKRVYVIALHDEGNKVSLFEKKFVGDRNKLFKANSNYADKNIIKGITVTVGDMSFKKTDAYYFHFGTSMFAGGNSYILPEPMTKYHTDYLFLGKHKEINYISQEGKKGEVREISLYGVWADDIGSISLKLNDVDQFHQLLFNPLNIWNR